MNINKKNLISFILSALILFLTFSFFKLVSADSQTYFPCGGDEQTTIMCIGDSQNEFHGFIQTPIVQVTPNNPGFFTIVTNNLQENYGLYTELILGFTLIILIFIVGLFISKRIADKDKIVITR